MEKRQLSYYRRFIQNTNFLKAYPTKTSEAFAMFFLKSEIVLYGFFTGNEIFCLLRLNPKIRLKFLKLNADSANHHRMEIKHNTDEFHSTTARNLHGPNILSDYNRNKESVLNFIGVHAVPNKK